nr:hypothetical protein [Tanacetum cinerariifolium]
MSTNDFITTQTCELLQGEFNDFLALYPVPSEYHVILPKSNQTIFDAPPGYVRLYTHSFSLSNLRLPLTEFFCKVIEYFQVHISRLNPFGCAKLITFVVMCKAYGCEPFIDLFQGFFNLCRAGKWLTFAKRYEKHIPNLLPKVITCIEGWHKRFFYVRDSIIPANRCPTSVRVFPDPILFLVGLKPSWEHGQQRPAIMMNGKEMDFRNFIYTKDDDDLAFLPNEPSSGFKVTADSGENPKAGVFVVHPGSVATRIKEKKCKTRGGSSRPLVKRKLASGSSSSCVVRAKNFASKDDALFFIFDDDEDTFLVRLPDCFELKDANACHLKISAITPPAWKGHLDNQMDLELLDLHNHFYARHAVVDNAVNRRARLRVKCEAAMAEFDQNPAILALREKISSLNADVKEHKGKARLEAVEASLRIEVEELKQDRRDVVSKVIPYAAMELVTAMKDPFDLSKAKVYHSSYQKDHTHASNDFATAAFPWLDEFVVDATAPIETMLSKKPPMLQKPAPSRTRMHVPSFQKATPSSAPSLNPMSPPADLVKPSPSPLE